MSASYTWVGWTSHKKAYDAVMFVCISAYLAAFMGLGKILFRAPESASDTTLLIRALGTCALFMLHIVLWIGPLARIDRRFLPLLYNRRHLGVATFLVALAHAVLSLVWYHGFGDVNPLVSLLTANTNYLSLARFPFEILGLAALVILFLMAATSHDFWLKLLTPRAWKWLHMLAYAAYGLLVMHVALGFLQSESHPLYAALLGAGVVITATLHLVAGLREARRDGPGAVARPASPAGYVDACAVDEVPESRAKVVCLKGRERIAVFRHEGKFSAVASVCAHQGGPLGEGKIVDGCITCPWHGWQYRPRDGRSPPPFTEKVATYRVRIEGRRVFVNPEALPAGTPAEPAAIEEARRGP